MMILSPSEPAVKTCFKCRQPRPLSDFYRHPRITDGHLNKCKFCAKTDVRLNRAMRTEYYVAYDRERGRRPGRVAMYQRKQIAYRTRYPERMAVYCKVYRAKKTGVLVPPLRCPGCGEVSQIDAHHEDYKFPLQVTWICPRCHHAHHHIYNYFTGQPVA